MFCLQARSAVRVARDKQEQAQRDAAAARDDAKDARDAAARNERALTQRDESLARTSKDFEAAATSEIEALKSVYFLIISVRAIGLTSFFVLTLTGNGSNP